MCSPSAKSGSWNSILRTMGAMGGFMQVSRHPQVYVFETPSHLTLLHQCRQEMMGALTGR